MYLNKVYEIIDNQCNSMLACFFAHPNRELQQHLQPNRVLHVLPFGVRFNQDGYIPEQVPRLFVQEDPRESSEGCSSAVQTGEHLLPGPSPAILIGEWAILPVVAGYDQDYLVASRPRGKCFQYLTMSFFPQSPLLAHRSVPSCCTSPWVAIPSLFSSGSLCQDMLERPPQFSCPPRDGPLGHHGGLAVRWRSRSCYPAPTSSTTIRNPSPSPRVTGVRPRRLAER